MENCKFSQYEDDAEPQYTSMCLSQSNEPLMPFENFGSTQNQWPSDKHFGLEQLTIKSPSSMTSTLSPHHFFSALLIHSFVELSQQIFDALHAQYVFYPAELSVSFVEIIFKNALTLAI
jgi:hypothetical protein